MNPNKMNLETLKSDIRYYQYFRRERLQVYVDKLDEAYDVQRKAFQNNYHWTLKILDTSSHFTYATYTIQYNGVEVFRSTTAKEAAIFVMKELETALHYVERRKRDKQCQSRRANRNTYSVRSR